MNEPTIRLSEAAARAHVHKRTLQRWCRERLVEHCRTAGGHFRFTEEQVSKIVERVTVVEHYPEVDTPNPWRTAELEVVVPIGRRAS